jgi:hypothetical protein
MQRKMSDMHIARWKKAKLSDSCKFLGSIQAQILFHKDIHLSLNCLK